jgi:hypothetical protein
MIVLRRRFFHLLMSQKIVKEKENTFALVLMIGKAKFA